MDSNGDTLLNEILNNGLDELDERAEHSSRPNALPPAPSDEYKDEKKKTDLESHKQWALGGNGRFSPVGSTTLTLPSGIYEPFVTPGMWGLEQISVSSDGIYILPDMATETVLSEVKKFWTSEPRYRDHGLLYKRGIILWGPPGSGKTIAVKILMQELVKREGIVVMGQNVKLTIMCLKAIRRIEPKRNLIVVLEDIDEIITYNGESDVLSLLDGESSIDNVLMLATTNYPEKLGARIINRPSRFDRRILVGMPSDLARRVYIQKATNDGLSKEDLDKWVKDTETMSVAHLRELVAAVYCLDQPYDDVVERLKGMATPVKDPDGFAQKKLGFKSAMMGSSQGW